jgi:hypothetical protein
MINRIAIILVSDEQRKCYAFGWLVRDAGWSKDTGF